VTLEVNGEAKCSKTEVVMNLRASGDIDSLDTLIEEDKLEVVDAEDKSSRKEVDKIGLEVTGDNVLATLYGSDICAHVDFLKLEFPSGSKIKILKDCTHTTTTTTTTTTVVTTTSTTTQADVCTDLTQGLTLTVETTAFCATGSDHVTMKLRGSDPLEADVEDEDLEIVNANKSSVREAVERIIFESDGNIITAWGH
ncbi:unnamed protein product, partial [Effrenium voratum]